MLGERHYAEHYILYCYAEFYPECHYAECRGAFSSTVEFSLSFILLKNVKLRERNFIGTMTFSIATFGIMTPSITVFFTECLHAECCKLSLRAECHHAECHYAECHYAECYDAECHYAKCR
jgi:hypothetical protein